MLCRKNEPVAQESRGFARGTDGQQSEGSLPQKPRDGILVTIFKGRETNCTGGKYSPVRPRLWCRLSLTQPALCRALDTAGAAPRPLSSAENGSAFGLCCADLADGKGSTRTAINAFPSPLNQLRRRRREGKTSSQKHE